MNNLNIIDTLQKIIVWAEGLVWSIEMLYQLVAIIISIALSWVFFNSVRSKVKGRIEQSKLPFHLKRIGLNLIKQIFTLTLTLCLGVAVTVMGSEYFGLETALIDALIKLLLAWVAVRISLQFISNNFVRNIFASIVWVMAALSIFGVLDDAASTLNAIGFSIGEFRLSALAVLKGAFAIFILLYMASFISSFVERRLMQMSSLTRSSQVLISKVIRVTLIGVAILIAITSAGIDLSLFAVLGGAVGLGIGFGLQKGVSNLFSGMLLLMDKSIKPGDVIEIIDTGTFGWVNHMAARYTEIVTRDNKSYLIPNEDFITQRVVNWSHGDNLIRIHVSFGVHYDSNPHDVMEVSIEAAKSVDRVVDERVPVCWITEFADSSINFDLRFWIRDAEEGVANVKGQVFIALWDAFKEHDIQIPYPHREVYMHEVKAAPSKKAVAKTPEKKSEKIRPETKD